MANSLGGVRVEPNPEPELFEFELHVPLSSRGKFFNQLKAYAEENGFTFYVRLMDPAKDLIGAEMRRDDVWMSFYSVFEIDQYFVAASPRSPKANADLGKQLEAALREKIGGINGAQISPLRR